MKRTFLDAALYLVVFLAIQAVVQIVAMLVCHTQVLSPAATTIATLISSVLAIALFAWRKWTPCHGDYINTRPWDVAAWAALLAVGLMTPVSYISDLLHAEMPDNFQQLFNGIMSNDLGFVTVGVVAPIAEEMVFRGAILRRLNDTLGHRLRWLSIAITALLFAVVHGNWVQGIGAFLTGLALGWVYVRTRSIVPGIIIHWVNNSIAVFLYRLMPGAANMTLTEYFNGDMKRVAMMLVCSLMIACAAIYQLNLRMPHTQRG
jgi:uncharacterized protein